MRQQYKSWFSSIVAILLTAFLVVVSAWVLWIVLQESKNTRLVYNSISTYAWAEWAQEYALLKIKNHDEWFQDKIVEEEDADSKLLTNDPDNINQKDQIIEYSMNTYSKSYSWTIASWDFEIIPLFFDKWMLMQRNSKYSSWTDWVEKTESFRLSWDWDYVWNIIWNDAVWETFWMVWTWSAWISVWWGYSVDTWSWNIKKIVNDNNFDINDDIKKITFENIDIKDFTDTYSHNYLILFNPTKNKISYSMESLEWFATPKVSVVASSRIWTYKQNLLFEENKNRYFEALKYSIFNK